MDDQQKLLNNISKVHTTEMDNEVVEYFKYKGILYK